MARPPVPLQIVGSRSRGRPRAEDAAALEARLIRVASTLFFQNGYGATSMNAVAAGARVSKTTLWARFPSKADLFRAIVREQTDRWGSGYNRPPTPRFDTLAETLFAYGDVVLFAGTSEEFVRVNRLIFSESERFPELGEAFAIRFAVGVEHVANHMRNFATRDGIPCRDADGAAQRFLLTLAGWTNYQIVTNREVTVAERREWLDATVRAFMMSRPGW